MNRYAGPIKGKISKRDHHQVLADIIAAARVFGGYCALLTKRHRIRYASDLMRGLPVAEEGRLVHPELVALVDEAWRTREQITRPYHGETLGPVRDAVAQAAIVGGRWVLLTLADRTHEVEADRVRRDFVSNTGHELRTPVTSVGLIAQALQACKDEPDAVEHFADRLQDVADRLEKLADDMLVLAVAQEPVSGMTKELVDVDDVISRAVAGSHEQARARHVTLRRRRPFHAQVRGDRRALVVALDNLISNAIHYSPKGSRVTVAARAGETDRTVSLFVADEGVGIAPDDQERVFERFYRTDEARSARAGGTGLGLAIVKHTALAHGGSVRVDSRLGVGSTFTITLPLAWEKEPSVTRADDEPVVDERDR